MRSFITDLCPSPNIVGVTVRKSRWNIHGALIEKTRKAGTTSHMSTIAERTVFTPILLQVCSCEVFKVPEWPDAQL